MRRRLGLLDGELDRGDRASVVEDDLVVTLDSETTRRLQIIAAAAGQSVQGFVTELIADHFDAVAEAEAAFEEYERTTEGVDAEVALTEFEERVAARSRTLLTVTASHN